MQKSDSKKIDEIQTTLGTIVGVFGKRFDGVDERLEKIEDRLDSMESRLTSIESEVKQINRGLDLIEERYGNIKGVTKEIDELRGRIAAIEKHLSTTKKIPA